MMLNGDNVGGMLVEVTGRSVSVSTSKWCGKTRSDNHISHENSVVLAMIAVGTGQECQ